MGFFCERRPLQTAHSTPPLDDALQVLLDSVSMGAVHPHTHTWLCLSPSLPLPPKLFAGNTRASLEMSLAAAPARINPEVLFWEMKVLKDTCICTLGREKSSG